MKANSTVVFVAPKRVTVEKRPMPQPRVGEMLVQTRRTLISTGTELTMLCAEFPPGSRWAEITRFPSVPGYDNVGVVIELGAGVDKSWLGRKVASYAPHAAFVIVRPENARTIQRDIADAEAVFFTLGEIVMNGVRRGSVTWGETVVVYGLGLLGQLVARFCLLAGARQVFGVDVAEKRLALLPKSPRIRGINAKTENAAAVVKELTRGRMADVVFEVTGNPDAIPQEFSVLRRQGRLVLLSSPRGETKAFDFHDLCNAPSYTIIGAHNSSHPQHETANDPWTQRRHAELFFDLVADGELDLRALISHRASAADAPKLYEMLLADRTQAMGVVLEWSE